MAQDRLRYGQMVETALRSVVREALVEVAEQGLPGDHHFYITFHTGDPGIDLADWLRAQYPQEMTVVLQHQFWGLEVEDDAFAVTLSFNGRQERLRVPFAAVVAFADPSAKFVLRFEAPADAAAVAAADLRPDGAPDADAGAVAGGKGRPAKAAGEKAAAEKGADVVALESFRKK